MIKINLKLISVCRTTSDSGTKYNLICGLVGLYVDVYINYTLVLIGIRVKNMYNAIIVHSKCLL